VPLNQGGGRSVFKEKKNVPTDGRGAHPTEERKTGERWPWEERGESQYVMNPCAKRVKYFSKDTWCREKKYAKIPGEVGVSRGEGMDTTYEEENVSLKRRNLKPCIKKKKGVRRCRGMGGFRGR